jgi:branched-chain amino acid transport system ATP-binding protein
LVKNDNYILEVNDITVSYGSIHALHGVSIVVRESEVVALIGSNGSGKSTLLAAVLGVQRPSSGTVKFMGKDITHKSTDSIVASGIAIAPEGRAILPLMSVMENLLLGTLNIKGDKTKYLKRAFEKFPILERRKKQLAGTLSGGEQQMVDIARMLMSEPKLIIMDEPSLGLSPIMVDTVFDIINNLKNEGHTILLSEQNARKALEAADRGYVLETGEVSLEGDAVKLRDDPGVRSAYLGISE